MFMTWKKISHHINKDNDRLLKHRPCPICGHFESKSLLSFENFQFFSDSDLPKQVDLHEKQCRNCGAIYLNPCYSNEGFSILFDEAGKSYGSTEGRPSEQINWLNERKLLEDNFKILDIGCGTGHFLASLPKNVNKVGVDIDAPSIELAKTLSPEIEFICSGFDDLEYSEPIDIITMFHVLEHLPNPKSTLQRLYDLSNKDTKLVIEIPIIENGFTNDINGFFSVQHLTHFSRNSLKNLLELVGWQIVDWLEQKDYNGCRILATKTTPSHTLKRNETETINAQKYLSHWFKSLSQVEEKILLLNCKYCIIWGGGMHLEFLYQTTSLFSKDIQFIIVDSDKNKQNKSWRGINIYSPNAIKELNVSDETLFIISSYGNQKNIKNAMEAEYNINQKNIIELYDTLRVY